MNFVDVKRRGAVNQAAGKSKARQQSHISGERRVERTGSLNRTPKRRPPGEGTRRADGTYGVGSRRYFRSRRWSILRKSEGGSQIRLRQKGKEQGWSVPGPSVETTVAF